MGRVKQRFSINGFKCFYYPNGIALMEKSLPKVRNEDDTLNAEYYDAVEKKVKRLMLGIESRNIVYLEVSRLEVYVPNTNDLDAITKAINEVIDGIPFTTDKRDRSKSSEYRRTYYLKNKEEIIEKQRQYNAEHKAEIQAYKRKYNRTKKKKLRDNLGF